MTGLRLVNNLELSTHEVQLLELQVKQFVGQPLHL